MKETGQTVFADCVLFIISWLITILGINTKSNTEYNCTVKYVCYKGGAFAYNINRPYTIHLSIAGTKNYITSLLGQRLSLFQGFTVQLRTIKCLWSNL